MYLFVGEGKEFFLYIYICVDFWDLYGVSSVNMLVSFCFHEIILYLIFNERIC